MTSGLKTEWDYSGKREGMDKIKQVKQMRKRKTGKSKKNEK